MRWSQGRARGWAQRLRSRWRRQEQTLAATLRNDPVRSRQIPERIPAGRWGEPADLAGAAVFLCSSACDYVHGHILAVDGVWLAR